MSSARPVPVTLALVALVVLLGSPPVDGGWQQNLEAKIVPLWDPPYELSGAGFLIGQWEEGTPLLTHPDLIDRVVVVEFGEGSREHATHVAGILIGTGTSPTEPTLSRGGAYEAELRCWDNTGAGGEFPAASAQGVVAANNSFTEFIGWYFDEDPGGGFPPRWINTGNQDRFGVYETTTQGYDQAIFDANQVGIPFIAVFPAGDDRNEGAGCPPISPDCPPAFEHDGSYTPSYQYLHPYFDGIDPNATGKNTITVGALDAWPNFGKITEYSNWGPTDDGRIKPDLVAKGQDVYGALDGQMLYGNLSGTTQAVPPVTAAAVLTIEQYNRIHGQLPRTGEVKALLINGAEDLGPAGPDALYGFGSLNAQAAVDTLIRDAGDRVLLKRTTIADGQTDTYQMLVPEGHPAIKLTLVWIDPPGSTAAQDAIINDLDLRLTAPSGGFVYPFHLDVLDPGALAASDGPNRVDTVEQVVVASPQPGLWQVEVIATDAPVGAVQRYALASDTLLHAGAPAPTGLTFARNPDGSSVDIQWDAVADPEILEYRIHRTDAIGQSLEWVATAPGNATSYTDAPPAFQGVLAYDVRAVYDRGGTRAISRRSVGLQSETPTIHSPVDGATVTGAATATRIIGTAAADSVVMLYENPASPVLLGQASMLPSGMFYLDHDFGGIGPVDVFAQTVEDDKGVSIPSLPVSFTLVP